MTSRFSPQVGTSVAGLAALMAFGCSATNDVSAGEDNVAGGTGAAGSTGAGNAGTVSSAASTGSGSGPDVTFDWPESTGPCKDGHYVGSFECMYIYQGGAPIPVNGSLDFFLEKLPNGEFLDIGNGHLQSVSNGVFLMTADIQGKFDCGQKHFDGMLVNGIYSGFVIINGMFDGPISADYDSPASAFVNGKWELHELTSSFGTCTGTWFANWVP